jgi:hypothetical protein
MLKEQAIRNARPSTKPYKLLDGEGLSLLVKSNGSKLWRFRYQFERREKMLSLGVYPSATAGLARAKRDEAKRPLTQRIDPSGVSDKQTSLRGTIQSRTSIESGWSCKGKTSPRPGRPQYFGGFDLFDQPIAPKKQYGCWRLWSSPTLSVGGGRKLHGMEVRQVIVRIATRLRRMCSCVQDLSPRDQAQTIEALADNHRR